MKNIQNKKGKNTKKTKSSDPWARSGERPGRGHGSELFVFLVFPWFFAVWPKPREHKKKQKKQKVQTHGQGLGYPHTNQKTKKQKTKKPRNRTKKPKHQKTKKTKIAHPKGRGSDAECWVLSFFFCFFCFFGLCVDSHCRCAKRRLPGTVSGCTRSKVDTLQYSNVCYDIVHSASEQQRGMEFNFVRLRHMLLDLCTGNAAICALPQWPVLESWPLWERTFF